MPQSPVAQTPVVQTRILLGVVWRDSEPYVRLREDESPASTLVPAAGLRLNYRLTGEPSRQCVGHVPFRSANADGQRSDYHDCTRRPQQGSRTCERCGIVDATFASNLHHAHTRGTAELDPAIVEHLQQPNRLYLAGFRDGSIKVGTSTRSRTQKRLEEQGAWMARLVAETTNGIAVRSLEDLVTEVWSLPQAVNARRKIKGLVDPLPDAELDRLLGAAARDVGRLMDRAPDERVHPLAMGEDPGERWRHPMAEHPALGKVLAYPLTLQSGNHDLEVITAVGRALLVRRASGDDVFAIDPAPLFGLRLDMGDYGSDEIAIQDSLF